MEIFGITDTMRTNFISLLEKVFHIHNITGVIKDEERYYCYLMEASINDFMCLCCCIHDLGIKPNFKPFLGQDFSGVWIDN